VSSGRETRGVRKETQGGNQVVIHKSSGQHRSDNGKYLCGQRKAAFVRLDTPKRGTLERCRTEEQITRIKVVKRCLGVEWEWQGLEVPRRKKNQLPGKKNKQRRGFGVLPQRSM